MTLMGLRTVIYRVPKNNLKKATLWYSKLLGVKPYFEEPFYVGFNVGGFELGLDPDEGEIIMGNNVVTYWGVKDIEMALGHSLKSEATKESDIREVGEGIKVATLKDPFGNLLGLIENPHFKIQ